MSSALHETGLKGTLEKKGRARSLFSTANWTTRTLNLVGQTLTYSDPEKPDAPPLGEVDTEGCTVHIELHGVQGKNFRFVLLMSNGDELELNATFGSKERDLWVSSIEESARSITWRENKVGSSKLDLQASDSRIGVQIERESGVEHHAIGASPDRAFLLKIIDERPEWEEQLQWKQDYAAQKVLSHWTGVVLDHESNRVVGLGLSYLKLHGELPEAISGLSFLEMLVLTGNEGICGKIPDSYGMLFSLRKFWCKNTNLDPNGVPEKVKAIKGLKEPNAFIMPDDKPLSTKELVEQRDQEIIGLHEQIADQKLKYSDVIVEMNKVKENLEIGKKIRGATETVLSKDKGLIAQLNERIEVAENKLAIVTKNRDDEIVLLKEQVANDIEQIKSEKESAAEQHKSEIEKLTQQNFKVSDLSAKVTDLTQTKIHDISKRDKKIDELENELKNISHLNSKMTEELKETSETYVQEIDKLNNTHVAEVDEIKKNKEEELVAMSKRLHDELRSQIVKVKGEGESPDSPDAHMFDEIPIAIQDEVDRVPTPQPAMGEPDFSSPANEAKVNLDIVDLLSAHQEEMEKMREELTKKAINLQEDMQKSHETALIQISSEYEVSLQALKEGHEAHASELYEKSKKLMEEHEKALIAHRQESEEEKQALSQSLVDDHNAALVALQHQHQKQHQKHKHKHEDELQQEVAALQSKLDSVITSNKKTVAGMCTLNNSFSMLSMCVLTLIGPLRSIELILSSTLFSIYIPPKHHTNTDTSFYIILLSSITMQVSF